MDAVPGVPLKDVWSQMTGIQHIQCIESLGKIAKELCNLDFAVFGSLYLNTANRPTEALPLDGKYCIGPHCARQHWGCGVGTSGALNVPGGCQGPCLTNVAKSILLQDDFREKSVDDHLRLLDIYRSTLGTITDTEAVQASSKPTLFHPDFHTRNIFVASDDPTQITGIIDWQSTAIEPAFVHAAETPDFAEELPFDKTLDANRGADMDGAEADAQRCAQTWAVLAYICPKLGKAAALDPLLCRYLATASSGWLDDPVSLRSLLTDLDRRWEDLGLPGNSLYQTSKEGAKTLSLELDELQSTQRLRMYLARLLCCETDGWVEAGRWEEVLPMYRGEYERFIEACVASREEGESQSEAIKKGQRLWPFDLR
ncbi:hypothetical protein LTR12_018298 [Friedmanniomyces endolithicus]|nr:hypothetical protein LTS01_025578 [Friedmanniomyces endolithicus]KAK1082535.1 hypothetical protein LTR33_003851 [Friedmanniomyces endolithicus]KAK1807354.1 hypothetical protein LTR12_018298 [Friedmanniomyces endolithicus]